LIKSLLDEVGRGGTGDLLAFEEYLLCGLFDKNKKLFIIDTCRDKVFIIMGYIARHEMKAYILFYGRQIDAVEGSDMDMWHGLLFILEFDLNTGGRR
jgi:hypothetical protein